MTQPFLQSRTKGAWWQLQMALQDAGWSIGTAFREDDWWAFEHWTIKRQDCRLVLSFFSDPMMPGYDPLQKVICVVASELRPLDRLDTSTRVAEMDMTRGQFDRALETFVDDIDGSAGA